MATLRDTQRALSMDVKAWNPETDELLIETPNAHFVVGVSRYLSANRDAMPESAKASAHYAEFELDGGTFDVLIAHWNTTRMAV